MTIGGYVVRAAIVLGLTAMVQSLGCACNYCDEVEVAPLGSGQYTVAEVMYREPGSDWIGTEAEALIGGEFEVDADTNIATLRYTREGTTYEVRFTIEQPE